MIDLAPAHLEEVQRILAEHVPDCEVRAFGSRATWTAKDYSDLDLAVVGVGSLGASVLDRLRESFEESALPIRVDVSDWGNLADGFREAIDGDCVVLQEHAHSRDWRDSTFGECATLVRQTVSPSECGDTPYIGLEHIGEGTLSLLDSGVASDVTSAKAQFQDGDILFGKLRPYFRKLIRPRFDGICSTDIWVVRPTADVDAGYLFYLMASQQFVDFATAGSEGTKMPRAKWEHVSRYPVTLPPLDEQRRIAHILGTLDDKIELNRRMSQTLEAMAQALFKSWFVDFDPVRAKAEGRPTGLPPDLDALFPDSFQDSELGEIPEGWRVGLLGDIAEERKRSVKPSEIPSSTPYISLAHMPQRSIALSQWESAVGIESGKSAFNRGEILFGKLRPYFHKVGFAPVDGVCSTDIVVAAPKSPSWFGLVLGHMSSTEFVDYTDAGSTGTRMPRTSWTRMAWYEIALPPPEVVSRFTVRVRSKTSRVTSATLESRKLSALRDSLLPNLITHGH